jgi:MoxR-like ATPase/Mg-chelatase subunit ChlD
VAATQSSYPAAQLVAHAAKSVVGMQREAELIAVALATGRHLVLEGPPGTGKSTLLRSISHAAGVQLHFVEGNAELTPSRLIGHHDPAVVIRSGYLPEAFVPGPLVEAVEQGGLLYLEELNRIPEESLNVLITALAEGEVHVPRVGRIAAHPSFRFVAAMNPADSIGTTRVAQAVYDRLCRVAVGYQDEARECDIVAGVTGSPADSALTIISVLTVRNSRTHRDLRNGSSVRGAIDFAMLTQGLLDLRVNGTRLLPPAHRQILIDAATAALSGRVRVDEGSDRTAEAIVVELLDAAIAVWSRRLHTDPNATEPDPGKGEGSGPPPSGGGRGRTLTGDEARSAVNEAGRRTSGRNELEADEDFNRISPEVGQLDEAAVQEMFDNDADRALEILAMAANATDRTLRVQARRLATQLMVRVARDAREPVRGIHRLRATPGGTEGDIDLDATLTRTDGLLPSSGDEVITRTWAAGRRAVCLLIDRSGSMNGHQVAMAAMGAAGVLLAADQRTDSSVVAFAKDSIVLQHQGQPRSVMAIVDDILTLRGRGETDLGLALSSARVELERTSARERVVILLSDAKHTTGQSPELLARGVDRLHVLATADDPETIERATALARAGRGEWRLCTSVTDLPRALNALLER